MQGLYSIGLLIISNIFMTLAWYGHLKLQEMKVISNWPLYGVILLSWGNCPAGVLLSGSGQPVGIPRERRPLQPHAVEGDTRGDYAHYLHHLLGGLLQGRVAALEPHSRFRLPGSGRLLRIYEMILLPAHPAGSQGFLYPVG